MTTDGNTIAAYLDDVTTDATDRPRSLAAAILARALRRAPDVDVTPVQYVEQEVLREAGADDELAAEMVYEIGSILVELRERFPDAPLPLTG